jgi:4-hydroxybenzoate polyprenyltransferase
MSLGSPVAAASAVRALALSAHPLPTAGVTAISAGLAALTGLGLGRGVLFTAAVFLGQLSIGWSNDWIDAARDRAAGRRDKPVAGGAVCMPLVITAAVATLILAGVLSFLLGPLAGLAAMTLTVAGWLYNLGLKKTSLSILCYAAGFGMLPAAATLARPGQPWPAWWVIGAGAVLGMAAHAANVLPDLQSDRATGVAGFWHRRGARVTATGGPVLLVVASVLVLFGSGDAAGWRFAALALVVVLALGGVAVGLRSPASRLPFAATIALAGIDLALFAVSGARLY